MVPETICGKWGTLKIERRAPDFQGSRQERVSTCKDVYPGRDLFRKSFAKHGACVVAVFRYRKYKGTMSTINNWQCGCGWVNGVILHKCARCLRTVTEGQGVLLEGSAATQTEECNRMRSVSGNHQTNDPVVMLLYLLARDALPLSDLERIVDTVAASGKPIAFTNGWLAQWAKDARNRMNGDFRN